MRRVAIVAGLVLVVALSVAAGLVAISHGWERDWIREQLELRLAEALEKPVSIGSVKGLLYQGVTLSEIRIGDADEPLIFVESLEVELESLRLRGIPRLVLERVVIGEAHVDLASVLETQWPWDASRVDEEEPDSDEARMLFFVEVRSVKIVDLTVAVSGEGVRDTSVRMTASIRDLDVEPEADVLPRVATEFIERVRVGGFDLSLAVNDASDPSEAWLAGGAQGTFDRGSWQLEDVKLGGPVVRFEGRGRGTRSEIQDSAFSVEVPSVEAFGRRVLSNPPVANGALQADVQFDGPIGWPKIVARVDLQGFSVGGTALGDLLFSARTKGEGNLTFDALEWTDGKLDLAAAPGAKISLDSTGISLSGLRLTSSRTDGSLSLEGRLPRSGGARFDELQRNRETSILLEAETWSLATLQPVWTALGIEVDGQLDARVTALGTTEGVQLDGQAGLGLLNIKTSAGALRGADFEISFDGSLEVARVKISGTADQVEAGGTDLGALVTEADLDGRTLTVRIFELSGGIAPLQVAPGSRVSVLDAGGVRFDEFVVSDGDQRIALDGRVDEVGAEHLRVELSPLDLGRSLALAHQHGRLPDGPNVAGLIRGTLQWHGPWARPEITADLRWTEALAGEFELGEVEAVIVTRGALVEVKNQLIYRGQKALVLEAKLPLDGLFEDPTKLLEDERTSIVATLDDFDLRTLSGFLPKSVSEVRGFVSAKVTARGAHPEVELGGVAEIRDGTVELAGLGGQRFESIRGHLSLSGQNVQIENFGIGSPAAGVVGRGEYSFAGTEVGRLQSELRFNALALDIPGLIRGVISGPVRLRGELEALELDGRIEVAGLNVQVPDTKDPIVREIRILSSDAESDLGAGEAKPTLSLIDNLRLDLQVVLSRNSWARGQGAEVELRGEIEATKERGGGLGLSGTVQTVRGTYEIYGRRFRIERGAVTLDGALDPDPLLDVRAVHRVRGVEIYAIIEGRLSEPLLRFESVPDLDETDIASYLLLGRPMSGTAGEEQVVLDAVAAQIATGVALKEFERLLGGDLPVDLIDVRVDGSGSESEIRAGVGKYVGDRLFLYYERGFGAVPTDELKAQYELTPNWSVESTVTAEGETAGDVVFELDF